MNFKLVPCDWDTNEVDVKMSNGDRFLIEWFEPGTHPADLRDGEARLVDGWWLIRRAQWVYIIAHAASFKLAKQSTADELELA